LAQCRLINHIVYKKSIRDTTTFFRFWLFRPDDLHSGYSAMIDRATILQTFVRNFVLKERAERCYGELMHAKKRVKFTNRLNHRWDTVLDMRQLVPISPADDNPEGIQRLLNFKDQDHCYVISNYGAFDDKVYAYQEIFGQIYAYGLGTILLNLTANRFFLDTEQGRGPAARFIGIAGGGS
jgi:hypothetical protein